MVSVGVLRLRRAILSANRPATLRMTECVGGAKSQKLTAKSLITRREQRLFRIPHAIAERYASP
jgi:hypothetical protein